MIWSAATGRRFRILGWSTSARQPLPSTKSQSGDQSPHSKAPKRRPAAAFHKPKARTTTRQTQLPSALVKRVSSLGRALLLAGFWPAPGLLGRRRYRYAILGARRP